MKILTAALSLLSAIAGWYYMFYSQAAYKLGGIEAQAINSRRIRLRRAGGLAMFLLAVLMFAGVWSADARTSPGAFALIWLGVIGLLMLVVILALIDLRLTAAAAGKREENPMTLRMFRKTCLLLVVLLPLVAGCEKDATSNLPTTSMTIGKKTYALEIAAKETERNHGLMERDSMPTDHGMIFIFSKPREMEFWMKNTRIPLDIFFLDRSGSLISIHQMKPYSLDSVPSQGVAAYAIELNAGQAEESGAKIGDILQIPDAVKNANADP